MLDPSAPRDFLDSFLVHMDKARASWMGGEWEKSDWHITDIQLICLDMIYALFKS